MTKDPQKSRHRTVPIPETITKVGKGFSDKLVIFKIPASKYWWVRYYTQNRVVKKSCKTTDKRDATTFAKKFYEDILLRERNLLPITHSPTFERVADLLIEEQQKLIDRNERNPKLNLNDKQKLDKDILPFFRGFHVKDISYKHLTDYLATLNSRKLKPATLKLHLNLIHKILVLANREGLIDKMPVMPKVKTVDSPRGWFSEPEYEHLKKTASDIINDKEKEHFVRKQKITYEMLHLIWFMTATFLRPSDVKMLRHRNIQTVEKPHKYLRIFTDKSKTANRPIVSMDNAPSIYQALLKEHKKHRSSCEPEDFVFFPHISKEEDRWKAMEMMGRQFDYIVKQAELKKSPTGEERTLYSLRHTAIMFRLTLGDNIDLLTLARNARTSVEMIERFYARHLNAEMNIDKIQSMRPKPTPEKPTKSRKSAKSSKSTKSTKASAKKPTKPKSSAPSKILSERTKSRSKTLQ